MKTLSCGFLGLAASQEILLCHVTGAWYWDIPKGQADPGEAPLDAALRETREECGLDLAGQPCIDLGRMPYRRRKDLHLFAVLSPRFDTATCHCASHYRDHWGCGRPEMDGFEWTHFERVHRRCARHMAEVLSQHLSLPALLQRLQAESGLSTHRRL